MNIVKLTKFLRWYIKENKIKKSHFAKEIGITRQHLYSILRDEVDDIHLSLFIKISLAMEEHPVALLRTIMQQPRQNHTLEVKYDGDNIGFIKAIDEGDFVYAGTTFSLTWIIQNIGRREWIGRKLICVDDELEIQPKGDTLGVASNPRLIPVEREIVIPNTKPWGKVEITAHFTAPAVPGDVYSYWKMFDAEGDLCFPENHPLFCRFTVLVV